MAKDKRVYAFGVHGITICNFFTGVPVKEFDVIGDLSIPVSAEVEDLMGGSHIWPVAGEPKTLSAEGTVELREFSEHLAEYLVAGVGAATAAESTGSITAMTNLKGTSVADADTGIVAQPTITTDENAELKAGLYIVLAESATTIGLYATSTVDLKKGTEVVPTDDTLIIATAQTITTAGVETDIADTGITLIGGSGTIAMTVGDSAYFEVYPPHAGVEKTTVGQSAATFKRVSLIIAAQKRTTGELGYIYCPNALCLGWPLEMKEKGWMSGAVQIKIYTHEDLDFSMQFTHIKGTSI